MLKKPESREPQRALIVIDVQIRADIAMPKLDRVATILSNPSRKPAEATTKCQRFRLVN